MNADCTNAQKKAEELIEKYGYEYPFVDVFAIAQAEGLTLKEYKSDDNDVLKNTAGFFDPDSKTIFVNKDDPPNRITFTVAHELGHFILQHEAAKYGVLPRWQIPGQEKEEVEKEADAFAANLLVPRKMLKKVMQEYGLSSKNVSILANMFGVSDAVMRYRLMRI